MTRRRRWARRLGTVAGLAVVGWLLTSYAVVSQLTQRVRTPFPEPAPTLPWGQVSPLRLTTADGLGIGAWFIDSRTARPDRPAVVLLPGNGATRSDCLPEAELLAADGCPVLLVTHRAHGDSAGHRNDFGYSARHDVVAAVGWLRAARPARPVVVWGRSLGAAAALFAAPDLPDVRGLLLECPYRDLRTATWNRLRVRLPLAPSLVTYAGMRAVAPAVLPEFDRISPVEAAARVPPGVRVLVLAGGADRRATPADAQAIRDRLGGRAGCVVFPAGDHLNLRAGDPVGYREAVVGFARGCGRE